MFMHNLLRARVGRLGRWSTHLLYSFRLCRYIAFYAISGSSGLSIGPAGSQDPDGLSKPHGRCKAHARTQPTAHCRKLRRSALRLICTRESNRDLGRLRAPELQTPLPPL
jgi:hypothetical protein